MARLRTRKHKVVLNRSVGGDLGITIMLTLLGIFMFLPMYYVVIQSFKPLDELWIFFASLAAYAMAKIKFPGGKFMFKSVRTSLMFHKTVTAVTNFLTMSVLGMIDTYWAKIVPAWGATLGLYLMKQFMDTHVNNSVLESARLDGAGEFRSFWLIAMPMVKPAWLTLIVYCFQDLWNAGSSIYIHSEQLKSFNYAIGQITAGGIKRAGASAAATVIMMLVPITVFIITQSNIIETMGSSGMKD